MDKWRGQIETPGENAALSLLLGVPIACFFMGVYIHLFLEGSFEQFFGWFMIIGLMYAVALFLAILVVAPILFVLHKLSISGWLSVSIAILVVLCCGIVLLENLGVRAMFVTVYIVSASIFLYLSYWSKSSNKPFKADAINGAA